MGQPRGPGPARTRRPAGGRSANPSGSERPRSPEDGLDGDEINDVAVALAPGGYAGGRFAPLGSTPCHSRRSFPTRGRPELLSASSGGDARTLLFPRAGTPGSLDVSCLFDIGSSCLVRRYSVPYGYGLDGGSRDRPRGSSKCPRGSLGRNPRGIPQSKSKNAIRPACVAPARPLRSRPRSRRRRSPSPVPRPSGGRSGSSSS
jgi:hypothetical protein